MKKLIALLLALVMCLPLAACGGNVDTQPTNEDSNSTEQQVNESTNSNLEQGTQNNDTADENTQSDEITITTDNWQEYLELKMVERWDANGCIPTYALCLKDEYADKQIAETTVLDVEWSGTWVYKEYTCDKEAKTYEIGDVIADKPNEDVTEQSSFLTQLLNLEDYANSKTVILVGFETDFYSYIKSVENFKVINASGTIRFE